MIKVKVNLILNQTKAMMILHKYKRILQIFKIASKKSYYLNNYYHKVFWKRNRMKLKICQIYQ